MTCTLCGLHGFLLFYPFVLGMEALCTSDGIKASHSLPLVLVKYNRRIKIVKAMDAKRSCVIGWDIYMDKVEALCSRVLNE